VKRNTILGGSFNLPGVIVKQKNRGEQRKSQYTDVAT